MHDLPSIAQNFRIAKIGGLDAKGESDHFQDLRQLVHSNEDMYPGIEHWFQDKVSPGLVNQQRVAYVGYMNEKPMVSAVLKRGLSTKICHLRVGEQFRDKNLGELVMTLLALASKPYAQEIHFTLPEGLWHNKQAFWRSFGFEDATKSGTQYRLFETELRCSVPYKDFWDSVLSKLPKITSNFQLEGFSNNRGLVMSIRPVFANAIMTGKKKVEVRRRFSKKWEGETIRVYACKPQSAILGEATISKVIEANPSTIWDDFGETLGCTKREFLEYAGDREKVYAILLEKVLPYRESISLEHASSFVEKPIRPPQSYLSLSSNPTWTQAISISNLLQGELQLASG